MPYRRRYHRRSKNKYMIVNRYTSINNQSTDKSGYITIISPTEITGKRKAKNFTLTFAAANAFNGMLWALVYVPSGYSPNQLVSTDPASGAPYIYEPSQNVIMCGLYDPGSAGNSARRFTRLSRTLNAGDGVALVYRSVSNNDIIFQMTYSYAITLN